MWDFTFKGTSALTLGFTTFKKYIPDLPDVEETNISIPGIDGINQLKKKFGSRIIPVKGILEGISYADLLIKIDAFKEFLYSDGDEQLIFNDQVDRYYKAQKLANEEINREATSCDRLLKFKCNDPFGYAVTADDDTKNNITTKGYQWTIVNNGQYWAFPVCTITFNQVQTHIYLRNTTVDGCRFDISKSFVSTDILVINSKDMSIRLNDINSPAGFGDGGDGKGAFILLKTGNNLMEIGTDDATLDVDVNINFRKIYL